jgi:zinc protease
MPAGDAFAASGNPAVPTLAGMMLDRGTRAQDKFAIAEQLEQAGAEIAYNVGTQSLQIDAKCLSKDLPMVLGLIAAELRTPAFSPAEFAKVKQEMIGSLENSLHSTDLRAQRAFDRAVFPPGHPNHPASVEEMLAGAKAASLSEVKAFHEKYYGPAHLTLVLVGDVSMPVATPAVGKSFSGWSGGQDYIRTSREQSAVAKPGEVVVQLPGKPSVSVVLGQPSGLRYKDPDALALRVGTAVLGQGFTGRLMRGVRDKQGLTYGIGAGMSQDSLSDGTWEISATFAPSLLDKGLAATRSEVENWRQAGVTERELEDRKQGVVGSYYVGLSTTSGVASAILNAVQRGYDLAWLDGYPQAVAALTRDQVNAAIKAHIDPASMVLVEAGSLPAATP